MSKRSSVALGTILKQTAKVIRYPWMAGRLAALEKEKFFFDFLNPQAELGQARSIRQLSIRITDMSWRGIDYKVGWGGVVKAVIRRA